MTMSKLSAIMLTWTGGQIICYVCDGLVLGGPGGMMNGMMQSALGFNITSSGGWNLIQLPIAFINLLSKVLFWNFSFLDGNFFIVKVLLTAIITLPSVYGLWQGLRGS